MTRRYYFLICIWTVVGMLAAGQGLVAAPTAPITAAASIPPSSASATPSPNQEIIVLTVDKSHSQADLRTLPENPSTSKLLHTFKIATGKVEGDKERQGDNKTPEGIYFTTGTIPSKQLAPEKYGPLAIPLNFPNPMDQVSGKTGYGIWLHGVGGRRIEDARVTEGCVAFQNSEITSLVHWLQPNHGVVVIAKDGAEVNRTDEQLSVIKTTRDWIDAWASRNLTQFIHFYADDFNNAGKDKDAYEAYKKAVFGTYKTMTVKMTNLRVVTHSKYALAMMNQDFTGDQRFKSVGRKMIYLRRDNAGEWKIVRELFDNFEMKPVKYTMDDVAGLPKSEANSEGKSPLASPSSVSANSNGTKSL